jgi:hypothetical protein
MRSVRKHVSTPGGATWSGEQQAGLHLHPCPVIGLVIHDCILCQAQIVVGEDPSESH